VLASPAVGGSFGRYELLQRLATGGMGEVFLARQRGPDGFEKLVVLKTLLPHLSQNDDLLTMFKDEARLSARLVHPNICQTFEFDQVDGTWFIAMEYLRGDDLRTLLRECGAQGRRIPVPLACRIAADAAAGLDFAHALRDEEGRPYGIVHRDISPQNVFVTFAGGVKIIDFGVAKAAGAAHRTRTGALKGKFAYMSPEQVAGAPLDARSDVFALGVVLHELLTGRRLFKADTEVETLARVGECAVAPPSAVEPELPRSLDAVVLPALAKDPGHRYRSAHELRLALEEWLIASRQGASSAHLESFLLEVYGERVQRARTETAVTVPATRSTTAAPRRHATIALATAAAAAAAGLSILAWVAGVRTGSGRVDPSSTVAAVPVATSPERALATVRLRLETIPAGAQVRDGATVVGTTPADWDTAPGAHELTFTLAGYREQRQRVVAVESGRTVVTLSRLQREARRPPRDPALKVER
jgi:eukaryotic-like serine/threonine-protein kinase